MDMQTALVALAIALSVGYAAYRVWQALRKASDPCYGCEGCALREQIKTAKRHKHKKAPCEDKKNGQKFGQ